MKRQFRDVTGGEETLSKIVPGLGAMNYVLGWFTVPVEVFLRWNFGERYYTRANFVAGLAVLLLFRFAAYLFSLLPIPGTGINGTPSAWMGAIVWWYIILGLVHFFVMWWHDVMGDPVHSFSAGRSWLLLPVGRGIFWVLNGLVNRIVQSLLDGQTNEREMLTRLKDALPVFRDVDAFTERYVEPMLMIFVAFVAFGAGQASMVIWLFFSVMAHNFYTGMRHQADRAYVLDLRDQMIEGKQMRAFINGGPVDVNTRSSQLERVISETAKEAEREPEVMETIRAQQPTLADAIAAFNARKNRKTAHSSAATG